MNLRASFSARCVAALIATLLCFGAVSAELSAQGTFLPIENNGFEQPNADNGTRLWTTSIPGWTFTAVGGFIDDGVVDPSSSSDSFLLPLPQGHQALIIQEATLEQTLSAAAAAGDCTFSACVYVENIATSTTSVTLTAGGVVLAELVPTVDGQWVHLEESFTIEPGSAAIGQPFVIVIDQWANPNTFSFFDELELFCENNPTDCVSSFATEVINFMQGAHAISGDDAPNALGDTPTTKFSSGVGGQITLGFGEPFSNSGTAAADLCIDEHNHPDCYFVQYLPADAATEAALIAAGFTSFGGYYDCGNLFCSDENIDIDAFVPGFAEGELSFSAVRILDDGSSGNGYEIYSVEAKFICPDEPMIDCVPGYALNVVTSMQGPGAYAANDAPGALGNDTSTRFSTGEGGFIAVNFGATFTTSGDADVDLCVDEYNVVDCYSILLEASNDFTEAALAASGLTAVGNFYDLGVIYCGDNNIDLDALIPGYALGDLRFATFLFQDDGSAGDGSELVRVESKFVCGEPATAEFAKIGDTVFLDHDCDGIRDAGDEGIAGVSVDLLDATGTDVLASAVTGPDGDYLFCVLPGTYVVRVNHDTTVYFIAPANEGTDSELDSDFAPATGLSAPVSVATSEERLDIDAGLCEICPGPAAFVNNDLPSCGPGIDQSLIGTTPTLGTLWQLFLDSDFPFVPYFIYISTGAPTPVVIPGSTCTVYPDLNIATLLSEGITSSGGNAYFGINLPLIPSLAGLEFTIQARVCDPSTPGPIPGTPDFPTNGVHIILGCP